MPPASIPTVTVSPHHGHGSVHAGRSSRNDTRTRRTLAHSGHGAISGTSCSGGRVSIGQMYPDDETCHELHPHPASVHRTSGGAGRVGTAGSLVAPVERMASVPEAVAIPPKWWLPRRPSPSRPRSPRPRCPPRRPRPPSRRPRPRRQTPARTHAGPDARAGTNHRGARVDPDGRSRERHKNSAGLPQLHRILAFGPDRAVGVRGVHPRAG